MPDSSANKTLPLTERTIVVTRAQTQAAEFIAQLESYGARVVACPTIEIVAPESYTLLDETLENLFGYDWIILTSTNGVEHFLQRLNHAGHEIAELDNLQVCAIGHATAEKLAATGVHVDVVPTDAKAEGVFAALADYLGGVEQFDRLNFLLPRAAVARDYLPDALRNAGARVDIAPAYRTVAPDTTERAKLDALLAGGAVDCITFTSASTVKNFAQLFDVTDLSDLLDEVVVACIGDITAQTAADYGLQTAIQPTETNTLALARAIVEFYFAGK